MEYTRLRIIYNSDYGKFKTTKNMSKLNMIFTFLHKYTVFMLFLKHDFKKLKE